MQKNDRNQEKKQQKRRNKYSVSSNAAEWKHLFGVNLEMITKINI